MSHGRKEAITQEELVVELRNVGCAEVSKRRLTDWRENDVLPPFDVTGAGRGKGRGRECSSWSDDQLVLNQALWVRQLLSIYRSFESCHLPLWMLGYPVLFSSVRETLSKPLREMTRAIQFEAKSAGEIEDIIDDAAFKYCKDMKRLKSAAMSAPKETLEAFVNILFNQDYDLNDAPFQQGIEGSREWQRRLQSRIRLRAQITTPADDGSTLSEHESATDFFALAPFIKQYLSLNQLKKAVEECTDNDLRAVARDLGLLREIALAISRLIEILNRDMAPELRATPAQFLPAIFVVGRLVILADLSLRRNGFAEVIDRGLGQILDACRRDINEELERELAASSHTFAASMKTCFEALIGDGAEHSSPN